MNNKPITIKQAIIGLIVAITVLIGGNTAIDNLGGYDNLVKDATIMDAVTATTTSSAIDIRGAKRATLFLDQDLVGLGSGLSTTTFAVTVSTDKSTFVTYNKLIDNVINSNSQDLTRVASKIVDDGTDYILTMDLSEDIFTQFKVTATTLGAGLPASTTATVHALIEF